MDVKLLRIFQYEVIHQCKAVLTAQVDLRFGPDDDRDRFWISIEHILVATANLSRLLWGQGGGKAAERTELRTSLEIDDTSPLRGTRVRNHFEHVDARWLGANVHDHDRHDAPPADGGSWLHMPANHRPRGSLYHCPR